MNQNEEIELLKKRINLLEDVVEKMGYIMTTFLPVQAGQLMMQLGESWTKENKKLTQEQS
jgi:hypothetical protein